MLKTEIKVTCIKELEEVVSTFKNLLEDERIDIKVRKEYEEKVDKCLNELLGNK